MTRPLSFAFVAAVTVLPACGGDHGAGSDASASASSDASSGSSSGSSGGASGAGTGSSGTGTGSSGGSGGSSGSEGETLGSTSTGSSGGSGTTTGGGAPGLRVGVDVRSVAPTDAQIADKNIYMGAYGAPYTRGPAQGVHDAIHARSFAIEAEGVGLVMSIVDLPGMGNQNTRAIRAKVAAATGLSEAQVLVGTTHSHSSPDLMGLWGGVPDSYRNFVIDETAASMTAAYEARVDAELKVGSAPAPANNRRGWGFTDDAMTVLDAFDLEGHRIGTLVNFAAHPVVLGMDNKLISCDYPIYFVQALEADLGAPVALFNGTLGDATPKVPDGMYSDDFARAEAYGALLAGIAGEIVAGAEVIEPEVTFSHRKWVQTVDNALFKLAAQLGILQYDFDDDGGTKKVTTQATYFRLGTKVQGVAFPGESLTRNGLAIKESMKAPYRMILGNTGDALGYFIPSDEWQTGKNDNYEESVSLGQTAGDNAKKFITELIVEDNEGF